MFILTFLQKESRMKKVLIALLVLGALVVAPEASARRRCPKKCMKKETQVKQSCPEKCTTKRVLTSEKWIPTMVPGRQKVKCYTDYTTCSNTKECCEEVPCEIECLPIDKSNCEVVE
jgi:hypothetical protein